MTQSENAPTTLAGGRYLLVSPLGEGGMATVYRCFDQRLQVWRAIKVLNPKYASSKKVKARFDTEAQTMALLEHHNIVRVYDVGTIGEISYIVMELVEGGTPVDWLESYGAMPPRLAVRVVEDVCRGIEAAHAKGIIHRDIKPHNVMITTDGVCRVTDFGIARVGDGDRSMTKTGAVMGTWGYMAPEQRSDAKTVDERGDVYAIAATLYTLLTNRIPMDLFAADRDKSVMSGVPEALYDIMIKATDYDRDHRYASVADLREALAGAAEVLPPDPPDTPPLVHGRAERRDPPTPEMLAKATPLVSEVGGPLAPTLLPNTGVDSTAGGSTINQTVGATPIPALMGRAGTSDSDEIPDRESRPKRGAFAWLLAAVPLLVGALLFVAAGALLLPYILRVTPERDTGEPVAIVPTDEPDGSADVDTDASDPDTRAELVAADPIPPPTPSGRRGRNTTQGTEQGGPDAGTSEPDPPADVDPDTEGDADPDTEAAAVDPDTEAGTPDGDGPSEIVNVDVRVEPEKEQCIQATPPASARVGAQASFTARLCVDDSAHTVVLNYRPAGTGSWQAVGMPKRLGAYRTVVQVDERFSGGLEYYIETDGVTHGSRSAPMRVNVQ